MPAPLRRDALRNRERVLKAARAMRRRGEALQPNVVAREAGVGVGTVYRHFATPQELAESLVLGSFEDLQRRAATVRTEEDLRQFLVHALGVFAANEDFAAAATAAAPALPATAEIRESLLAALAAMFERAWGADRLARGLTPADVLVMLCGLGHAIRNSDADPDRADRYLDAFLTGVLREAPVAPSTRKRGA